MDMGVKRIGIDFDNIIAGCDDVFTRIAIQQQLVPNNFTGTKRQVRDQIRKSENGEAAWQKLQAIVYGRGIRDAVLIDGVSEFFRLCRKRNVSLFIVSHKTEFGYCDSGRMNLRQAAKDWMAQKGFFTDGKYGLDPGHVFFADTRAGKVSKLASLECDLFIDDLEEVFIEPGFPDGVEKYLYAPGGGPTSQGRYKIFRHWNHITYELFNC